MRIPKTGIHPAVWSRLGSRLNMNERLGSESGSMVLALMITVMCLVISVGLTSIVAWQVAQNRSEDDARRASWALDTAINAASEQMGSMGSTIVDLPSSEPAGWTTGASSDVAYKWWIGSAQTPSATSSNLTSTYLWRGLGYGGGKWVALTNSTSQQVLTSLDGSTWSAPVTSGFGTTTTGQAKVVYGLGKFIVLPDNPGANYILISSDGVTWSQKTLPATGYYTAACSSTRCVFVNRSGTNSYYTSDFTTYTAGGTVPAGTQAVSFGNNQFLAVGTSVAYSVDGTTWTTATTPTGSPWGGAAWVGGVRWAVYSAGTYTNKVIVSTDAITWSSVTLPQSGTWVAIDVAGSQAALVPRLNSATSGVGDYQLVPSTYLVSNDGKSWSSMALPNAGSWLGVTASENNFLIFQAGTGSTGPPSYLVTATAPYADATAKSTIVVKVQAERGNGTTGVYMAAMSYAWDDDLKRWLPDTYYGNFDPDTYVAPTTPTNFYAGLVSNGAGGFKVDMTWTGASSTAVTYRLVRQNVSVPLLNGSSATSYSDTSNVASPCTGCTYYLYAVNWAGISTPATVTAAAPPGAASAPSLSIPASTKNVAATWTAVTNATSYTLFRCPTVGVDCKTLVNGSYVGSGGTALYSGTSLTYTDTVTTSGTSPYYYITAYNAGGASTSTTASIQVP